MNELRKSLSTDYVAAVQPSAGSPALPARPGYWTNQPRTECRFEYQVSGVEDGGVLVGVGSYVYVCRTVDYLVYVPPRPATPAVPPTLGGPAITTYEYNLGWNAGGHSIEILPGSGYARFKVPTATIGAIVGLGSNSTGDVDYRQIDHAFYCGRGIARIYERGVERHYYGPYSDSDEFEVWRNGPHVTYWIAGALIYSSLAPSVGPMVLDASLYSGGDMITEPELVATVGGGGGMVMGAMRGQMGDLAGGPSDGVHAVMRPMVGAARAARGVRGSMLPLRGIAATTEGYSRVIGTMPRMGGSALSGELTPSFAIVAGFFSPLVGLSRGLTGTVGGVTGPMRPMRAVLADAGGYSRVIGVMAPLGGYSHALDGAGNASMGSRTIGTTELLDSVLIAVVMNSVGTVTAALTYESLDDALLQSSVQALTDATVDSLLTALMLSTVGASTLDSEAGAPGEVWVVNLRTGASWRYENFAFNSFAKIGSRYYGARPDGIYLLEGDDDGGVDIAARINLGRHDFNVSFEKRIEAAYLSVGSAGTMQLKVTGDDGVTYTYAARRNAGALQQQRIDVGRGLKANYIAFEVVNQGGADFELAGAEFLAGQLSRRIK
ncbi:MAG: hypothetical protein AAB131_18105 [Actinomycetota bacterium]